MKSSASGLRETRELLWLRSVWPEVKVGWPDSKGATFETNATREAMALQKEAPRNDNFALWCDLSRLGERSANRTYKEEGLRRFYNNIDEAQGESRLA